MTCYRHNLYSAQSGGLLHLLGERTNDGCRLCHLSETCAVDAEFFEQCIVEIALCGVEHL